MSRRFFTPGLWSFLLFISLAWIMPVSADTSIHISSVGVQNIMGPGAQIYWTTDIPADSNVSYGPGTGGSLYSNNRCDAGGAVVNHCVNLMNLLPSTIYYYKVKSYSTTDSTESIEMSFTSAAQTGTYGISLQTNTTTIIAATNTTINILPTPISVMAFGSITEAGGFLRAYVSFNNALNSDTLSDSQVYIINATTRQKIDGVVTKHSNGVDYRTSLPGLSAVDYQLVIKSGIKDINGSQLTSDYMSQKFQADSSKLPSLSLIADTIAATTTMDHVAIISTEQKTIHGNVYFARGGAVPDAEVGAYNENLKRWVSVPTDAQGGYLLHVSGGTWKMGIRPMTNTAKWSYVNSFPTIQFADDSNPESRSLDFEIPLVNISNTVLGVKITDDTGKPVPDAGVLIDTSSAAVDGSMHDSLFRTSGSDGLANFNVRAGTYYIRARLSETSGFINPPEKVFTVTLGETNAVTIILSRANTARDAAVFQGRVLLDGKGTSASVWASSLRGESMSATADSSGSFTIALSKNTLWQIAAGKKEAGEGFLSTSITVDTNSTIIPADLVLEKIDHPLPKDTSIQQISSKKVDLQTDDGAKISLEPNAVSSGDGSITVAMSPTVEAPSQPAATVIGVAYDITAKDSSGNKVTSLKKEAEISLPYDPKDLLDKRITIDSLVPSYFDEKTGSWVKISTFIIDTKNHKVIVKVNHLTRFALVAAADITPPLSPSGVIAKLDKGTVRLTWKNPIKDFDHIKIYRSTQTDTLGRVVAPEVTAELFSDTALTDRTTYYYTLRAIDPAGNESSNMNHVQVLTGSVASAPSSVGMKIKATLKIGSRGDQVIFLQKVLIKEKFLPTDSATGYFGRLTQTAVKAFQEKYADKILKPSGLVKGSGVVGAFTRIKINSLAD